MIVTWTNWKDLAPRVRLPEVRFGSISVCGSECALLGTETEEVWTTKRRAWEL